jgi:ribosomal protein S12 methylthiotransferase accessory factor
VARLASNNAIAAAPPAHADRADGLARLKTLASPYVGIVRRVHENARAPDEARMAVMISQMATAAPTVGSPHEATGGGADYDVDAALTAALGEGVERYAGLCVPRSGVVVGTASELGPRAVRPERFALHSEDQYAELGFPFEPFTSDTRVRWVKGWSIPDGSKVLLPLQLVYLTRHQTSSPTEPPIGQGSSNGMALGVSSEEATLRGLLELIERDALILTWTNRLSFPRLDWSRDEELVERDRRHFTPTGLRYEVLDLSVFTGVPTALALILGSGDTPVIWGIGAACRPTMAEAWDKALRECFQTRALLKLDLIEDSERCMIEADEVRGVSDHAFFYARAENHAKLDFLVSSEETRDIREIPGVEGDGPAEQIVSIARRLKSQNVYAYAADVTSPDVEDAGLRVVHVLSPELLPISFPHLQRFLGGSRLYEAAYELGLLDRPQTEADMNSLPHPFP